MPIGVFAKDLLEQPCFNLRVDCVLLFISRYFDGDVLATVAHVDALDDLAKGPLVQAFLDKVSVSDLLALAYFVQTIWGGHLAAGMDSDAAHGVNVLEPT